ncbi:hypothetical protein BDW68DRAFT_180394 [Aspergillus falconensis]
MSFAEDDAVDVEPANDALVRSSIYQLPTEILCMLSELLADGMYYKSAAIPTSVHATLKAHYSKDVILCCHRGYFPGTSMPWSCRFCMVPWSFWGKHRSFLRAMAKAPGLAQKFGQLISLETSSLGLRPATGVLEGWTHSKDMSASGRRQPGPHEWY